MLRSPLQRIVLTILILAALIGGGLFFFQKPSLAFTENFAPVEDELHVDNLRVVEGRIPPELNGTYFRIGPNPPYRPRDTEKYFFLDGDAMIHAVRLQKGSASYFNRWVQTPRLSAEQKEGKKNRDKIPSVNLSPTPNLNVFWTGKSLLALGRGIAFQMDPLDLSTLGKWDFHGQWQDFSTNNLRADADGVFYAFGHFEDPDILSVGAFGPDEKLKWRRDFDLGRRADITTYTFSEHYIVTYDQWGSTKDSLILVPKSPGEKIRRKRAMKCNAWDLPNAYEQGDQLDVFAMMDCAARPNMAAPENESQNAVHWRGHLVKDDGTADTFIRRKIFPAINPRFQGRKFRWLYAGQISANREWRTTTVEKREVHTGETQVFELKPGSYAGHLQFIPRPEPEAAEDAGWLLTYLYESGRSYLLILDPQQMSLIAKIEMPRRIPYGSTGTWVNQ